MPLVMSVRVVGSCAASPASTVSSPLESAVDTNVSTDGSAAPTSGKTLVKIRFVVSITPRLGRGVGVGGGPWGSRCLRIFGLAGAGGGAWSPAGAARQL